MKKTQAIEKPTSRYSSKYLSKR